MLEGLLPVSFVGARPLSNKVLNLELMTFDGAMSLVGLGIGAASNLTPLYISEISPAAIRGQLVGMYEIGWQIGGIVGFWCVFRVSTM